LQHTLSILLFSQIVFILCITINHTIQKELQLITKTNKKWNNYRKNILWVGWGRRTIL